MTPSTDGLEATNGESTSNVSQEIHHRDDHEDLLDGQILATKLSRNGNLFATITRATLTVWQAKPTVAIAAIRRSNQSLKAYGHSVDLLLRPDALIVVVQTALGYLITYTLATDPQALVYQLQFADSALHSRKASVGDFNGNRRAAPAANAAPGEGDGIREVNLRFRMVIRIDAGISKALATDDELIVATQKPAALQCIRWTAEPGVPQTSTEVLSEITWIESSSAIQDMVYDRPMNLFCWVSADGKAYAVQRPVSKNTRSDAQQTQFRGYCFRSSGEIDCASIRAAINARFSVIAVGATNGQIDVYAVKDYTGNIPLSHRHTLAVSADVSGALTTLAYSPDGYCLFAGYEKGWAMWSVYGKAGATSFSGDRSTSRTNDESWLEGIKDGFWLGGGSELAVLCPDDDRLWILEIVRNAAAGCLSPANIAQGMLHSSRSVMMYNGGDSCYSMGPSLDSSILRTVQIPGSYIANQWPIKSVIASGDGKYVAVAGQRGLAHYSCLSARWKTFEDVEAENEFSVRGGMCWYHHFLIAAVSAAGHYQLRAYSREKNLGRPSHVEELAAPAILTQQSGMDSLLVYTQENSLLHYIIMTRASAVRLVQVGQIGFHGIIRAPPRVRSVSWILPEDQLEHGDPSQDVATASVLFLVDGKLVLLQPSTNESGELKYDMRTIAQNVEYYILQRDQPNLAKTAASPPGTMNGSPNGFPGTPHLGHSLRDSLWYFDGEYYHVWSDVQDVLACAPADLGRDLPPPVRIPVDFYPISARVTDGIIHGVDADLVQRRDVNFSFFRHNTQTQLFLPHLLRHHLTEYNSPAALHLATAYQHLRYFSHALEILLHDVLDAEVDSPPMPPETALLPTVISFLSSFPAYLDVIVNCTRKTELRSWQTLFSYLPPVTQLFQESLSQGKLQTAGGYLLVLHSLEHDDLHVREFGQLLRLAAGAQDWELCKELARFLVGIDNTGQTLSNALGEAGLQTAPNGALTLNGINGTLQSSARGTGSEPAAHQNGRLDPQGNANTEVDYFAMRHLEPDGT